MSFELSRRNLMIAAAVGLSLVVGTQVVRGLRNSATQRGARFGDYYVPAVELEGAMARGEGVLVDIRTPQEWADTGVFEGAHQVTFQGVEHFLAEVGPFLGDGATLYLICRSGNRSRRAADALSSVIDTRIVSVDGGMSAQIAQGYVPVPARSN